MSIEQLEYRPRNINLGRPKGFDTALILEALAASRTVESAAEKVGCTGALIHSRAKTDPTVKAAIKKQKQDREDLLAHSIIYHNGILSKVADEVGLSSAASVRYHITQSPVLRQVFDDARDRMVDRAQDNVFAAVIDGDLTYSWKLLQTLGKDYGYTERREVDTTVTHSLDTTDNGSLKDMLNRLAESHPDAVEAEFSVLPAEDRELLSNALSKESNDDE